MTILLLLAVIGVALTLGVCWMVGRTTLRRRWGAASHDLYAASRSRELFEFKHELRSDARRLRRELFDELGN